MSSSPELSPPEPFTPDPSTFKPSPPEPSPPPSSPPSTLPSPPPPPLTCLAPSRHAPCTNCNKSSSVACLPVCDRYLRPFCSPNCAWTVGIGEEEAAIAARMPRPSPPPVFRSGDADTPDEAARRVSVTEERESERASGGDAPDAIFALWGIGDP